MKLGTLGVQVTGPLTDFAPGFVEELGRLGYAHGSARNQLRVVAHLSRWLEGQGLSLSELTRSRLIEFLSARRSNGRTCWVTERGLAPLVHYLIRLGAIPTPEMALGTSPVDRLLEATATIWSPNVG